MSDPIDEQLKELCARAALAKDIGDSLKTLIAYTSDVTFQHVKTSSGNLSRNTKVPADYELYELIELGRQAKIVALQAQLKSLLGIAEEPCILGPATMDGIDSDAEKAGE